MTFFAAFLGSVTAFASMEIWKWWRHQYKIEKKDQS